MEPVHWLDPRTALESEEAIQISVIDEIYPELRLADRVIASRQLGRQKVWPEAAEPAHVQRQVWPGVREPAHFQKLEEMIPPEKLPQFLSELAAVLRRYGFKF